ncbi:MAG TPA: amidohydrolase family protein [Puia sp.]|nr:amidohydrolase family protein [Puia sp.]
MSVTALVAGKSAIDVPFGGYYSIKNSNICDIAHMIHPPLIAPLFLLFVFTRVTAQEQPIALVGATVINVAAYGNDNKDLLNAVVLVENGRIKAIGSMQQVTIPANAKKIHVEGKFIIPGLIDCFSTMTNQGQANAQLYMGVTTIVAGPGDPVRGAYFPHASPSPRVKMLATIPDDQYDDSLEKKEALSSDDIARIDKRLDHLDSLKSEGFSVILVLHRFPQELMPKLARQTRLLGMSTIGEMQYASYRSGLENGIQSFVHTTRYILEAMPDSIRTPLLKSPNDPAGNRRFFRYFQKIPTEGDTLFDGYAHTIAASRTSLMPTLAMIYSALPNHKNLWKEPGASLLDPKDIDSPMDTVTGKNGSTYSEKTASRHLQIENAFIKAGVHYITGSGAGAFGSMPGISEQIEIALLHQAGLTNRQALAAATNNASIFNGWGDLGLVAPGRYADFLVLSANPVEDLENLKKIDMIWLNGRPIDREGLLKKAH